MSKLALAFIAGMATMYFLDPQQGQARRQRWAGWWQHSWPVLHQTGRDIGAASRQLIATSRGIGDQLSRGTNYATSRVRAGLGH